MTLVKLSFFKKKIFTPTVFTAVVQMLFQGSFECIVLGPLIHDTGILIRYQTGAIASRCFGKVT